MIKDFKGLKGLFLDDVRDLNHAYAETSQGEYIYLPWDIVKSYDEFVAYIEKTYLEHGYINKLVSFDHDLDIEHYSHLQNPIPYERFKVKTGWHCAKWLKEFCDTKGIELPEQIMVHTMNPAGYRNIVKVFS